MDVLEAIRTRRTIRAYRPDPVPKEMLAAILDVARLAPSWGNTQPWEFAILTGEPLETLRRGLYERTEAGIDPNPDVPAPTFPDELQQRYRGYSFTMYDAMGIGRGDREARRQFTLYGGRLFDTPYAIIIYMDRRLGPWSMLDIGLVMQTIMLAARAHGLGTSPLYSMVRYPELVRQVLKVPDSKQIICGIAIGYADEEAPQNRFERPRVPLDELVTWSGFE